MNALLFAPPVRLDRGVATTPDIDRLLAGNAPVAIGVSGGKDSCVLGFATVEHLNAIGHQGPRILIHSDLGRVEWRDSAPSCRRLADRLGLDLVTVRRQAGDMMDRWLARWASSVQRYADLECVKLILPWSTPSMRFCTSELKTDVMCRDLVRRFPGQTIVSACGIRRQESPRRRKAPVASWQEKLTSAKWGTRGIDWNAILEWTIDDVLGFLASRAFVLHEAYTRWLSSRVSCVFCMMGSEGDLAASAACPDNQDVYREMVGLEVRSTFSFQSGLWLGDIRPDLLTPELRLGLIWAKAAAGRRERAEARIPDHLLYQKGWPACIPTRAEAELLCEVRQEVADIVGLTIRYTEPGALIGRYEELMALKLARAGVA